MTALATIHDQLYGGGTLINRRILTDTATAPVPQIPAWAPDPRDMATPIDDAIAAARRVLIVARDDVEAAAREGAAIVHVAF
jgi:hypothetical protein